MTIGLFPQSAGRGAPARCARASSTVSCPVRIKVRRSAAIASVVRAVRAAWGDVRTAFEHACRRAKITDFRFHDLRHTCASWLIMRGRSLKEVQEILGPREFSMILRYADLSPDRLREAVAALEDFPSASAQKSAQSGKLDPAPLASPRKAGVAQW